MGRKNDAAAGGKSRSNLVPALVVAAGLLGGGFLMGGRGSGTAAATATTVPPHEEAPALGPVIRLDPITLNLADGRLLKVAIALQLPADAKEVPEEEGGGGFAAKALDETIAVLGEQTYATLAAPGGRHAAKQALSAAIAKRYHGEVVGVYFTEFVMQ